MTEIEKILQVANSEVGYLEKASRDQLGEKTANAGNRNYTKYAEEMDALKVYNGPKQGYAWCNVFVDWCFYKALGVDRTRELLIGFSAGCTQDYNWMKAKGQTISSPTKGDLIFFGDLSHIGIVEDVRDRRVYTIEGNTSNAAELIINGGQVAKKSYALNSRYIYGYARPKYSDTIVANPDENVLSNEVIYPLIKKGSKGNYVRIAQEKLLQKGYVLPKYGPDGDFGSETEEAVKQLQRDVHIDIDGKVGKDTWDALNSVFVKPVAVYPGYLVKRGQQGENVRKVQAKLIEKGYSCGNCGADSIFGSGTYNAVVAFQKANGLSADGIVGPQTWAKLF